MKCPKCGYTDELPLGNQNPKQISNEGLDLIRHFESCHLEAYLCPANVWTIGWGHTGQVDGKGVARGMTITQEKANLLLKEDMIKYARPVIEYVNVPLTQNRFDALVSFTFNCGANALKTSTLLKLLNQGKCDEVPAQLLRWNRGGGKVLAGLTRRRQAEGHLWTTGELKFHF